MPIMLGLLEGIALNPSVEASVINLVSGIAVHLLNQSGANDATKKLALDLLANSGKLASAVVAGTSAAHA
jgi:hypothetical protein